MLRFAAAIQIFLPVINPEVGALKALRRCRPPYPLRSPPRHVNPLRGGIDNQRQVVHLRDMCEVLMFNIPFCTQ